MKLMKHSLINLLLTVITKKKSKIVNNLNLLLCNDSDDSNLFEFS